MRIAWISDATNGGGVGGMARQFLEALPDQGVDADWYFRGRADEVPSLQKLVEEDKLRCFQYPYDWDWNSWYGRHSKLAFLASFLKRIRSHNKLISGLLKNHDKKPYDAIIQFSQAELFHLRRRAAKLPLILFPCVHAAGELRWTLLEDEIARRYEPALWCVLRKFYLHWRTAIQRRDYNLARGVIGMSHVFNREVATDYGMALDQMGVVYHPIEPVKTASPYVQNSIVRLLFVGRISVRKGLDLLLDVIPSILEKDKSIEVTFVGGGSLWSNYEPLMQEFPSERCSWKRSLPNTEVQKMMQCSDVLLAPSQYEPGGIVVGEALANGMVVVVSDVVGSAENLSEPLAFHFKAGDRTELMKAIDRAVLAVRSEGNSLRDLARTAVGQFAPSKMASLLVKETRRLLKLPDLEASSENLTMKHTTGNE